MTLPARGFADVPRTSLLLVRGLSKTFLGQRALDDVSFELRAGEVHALIGQNGSGKSTLIKCLAGYHEPDSGASFVLDGRDVSLPYTPSQATQMGLVFVHQDLGLIPNLSVAENFAISRQYGTRPWARINWKAIRRRAIEELELLGHQIPTDTPVSRLSVAEQTLVAIARALASAEEGARVLVLDEPTAALPDARRDPTPGMPSEVERLFAAVRNVVGRGVGVIYVSHKLEEVRSLADRATILRDGRNTETVTVPGLTERDLIRLIVGHDVARVARSKDRPKRSDAPLLRVTGVSGRRLHDVSFTVDRGEVVGVAGMLGSGRSELARILFGAQRPEGGRIQLRGTDVRYKDPSDAVRDHVVLIPEDRRRQGGFLQLPVGQNLTLPSVFTFWKGGRMAGRAERGRIRELINDFGIVPNNPGRKFGVLSGGNQQKVVIAKWLNVSPDLVIFDEPVQGVDVGARADIFQLIVQASRRGAGIVLISSELDQMLDLCNRVIVLRNGRVVADQEGQQITRQSLAGLMYFGGAAGSAGPTGVQVPTS